MHRHPLRRWLRDHGLSIVLAGLFVLFLLGQSLTGQRAYNEEQREHGRPPVDYGEYIGGSHFAEATFENFESEFLQMAAYVLLTVFLFQRGSAESNDPDAPEEERPSPRRGIRRRLYEHSLTIAFTALFALSFIGHAVSGAAHYKEEQHVHGAPTVTVF